MISALNQFGYGEGFSPPEDKTEMIAYEFGIASMLYEIGDQRKKPAKEEMELACAERIKYVCDGAKRFGTSNNGLIVDAKYYHIILKAGRPTRVFDPTLYVTNMRSNGYDEDIVERARLAAMRQRKPSKSFSAAELNSRNFERGRELLPTFGRTDDYTPKGLEGIDTVIHEYHTAYYMSYVGNRRKKSIQKDIDWRYVKQIEAWEALVKEGSATQVETVIKTQSYELTLKVGAPIEILGTDEFTNEMIKLGATQEELKQIREQSRTEREPTKSYMILHNTSM